MAETGYDSERDLDNPTGSVFCAHGAGFLVPWYQVEEYMHVESQLSKEAEENEENISISSYPSGHSSKSYVGSYEDEKELQAIFERTFGPVKREQRCRLSLSSPGRYGWHRLYAKEEKNTSGRVSAG